MLGVLFITTGSVALAEVSSSVRIYTTKPTDEERVVQQGMGVQIDIGIGDFYLYGSSDKQQLRFGGQGCTDLKIHSLGFGIKHSFKNNFSFFADVGWYEPDYDKDRQEFPTTILSEGLFYYLNNELGIVHLWDYYTIKYHGAIGGKLGVAYNQPLFCDDLTLNISFAYRLLKMGEMVQGRDYGNTTGWWEYKQDRDLGGYQIGIWVTYKF